ncbi:uncharacterized protein PGRI_095020 [Penicillium griseofulvum]|uniref:Uncharacterized protein n=1 Tax=Penicillium patulum TaxID=5078 RepID=A0A135LRA1_PENPA|nr:uncharacterized protein PGRI_095020 [Penicillium griseofulvum]KXG51490.1 hypothetical protein PGRI_095020 [Penicillium griseofulvum]
MPSKEHGAATGTLASEVSKQLGRMGPNVENEIVAFSGSGIRAEGRGKEADFAWGPQVPPDAVDDSGSVTVAVEVAVSQKPTMLKRDIDYWLSPTAGNANLVIAVKVGRSDPEVSIELWRQADRGAHRTQHTIIKKVNSRVIILGDEVTIPFKDLLGRERSAPGEIDVTITKEQLERVARAIWSQQRF